MKTLLLVLSLVSTTAFAGTSSGGGTFAPLAIEVSFISIGAGIDRDAKAKIDQAVASALSRGHATRLVELAEVGMEGESKFCVEFSDYDTAQIYEELLYKQSNPDNKLTSVSAVSDCSIYPQDQLK